MKEKFNLGNFVFGKRPEVARAEKRERMVNAVGGVSHVAWRNGWKAEHGNEPRLKPLDETDAAWLAARQQLEAKGTGVNSLVQKEDGSYEVNIASLDFPDLPPSRKRDSLESAQVAVDAVLEAVRLKRHFDRAFMEEAAGKVHARWIRNHAPDLERFEKEGNIEEIARLQSQLVPYADLPEPEKEKDREYVRNAIYAYRTEEKRNTRGSIPSSGKAAFAIGAFGAVLASAQNQDSADSFRGVPLEPTRPTFEEPTVAHILTSEKASAARGEGAIDLLENFFERMERNEELRSRYGKLFPGAGLAPKERAHVAARTFDMWRPNERQEAVVDEGGYLRWESDQGLFYMNNKDEPHLLMLPDGTPNQHFTGRMQEERLR